MALLNQKHTKPTQAGRDRSRRPHARARRLYAFGILLLTLSLTLSALPPVAIAQRAANLDSVKAAFTKSFTNFVVWPESTFKNNQSPFLICVLGNETVTSMLKNSVKNTTIKGRKIIVENHDNLDSLPECQLLFIDKKTNIDPKDLINKLMDKPVLTFSDNENFTKDGGIIRIYLKNSRPKLEINVDAVERSGLRVRSDLLSLAEIVHDK